MDVITDTKYRANVEVETKGFHVFSERRPKIGERRVFIYPDWGTPTGYPEYLAHRFHVVEVTEKLPWDHDEQGEDMFKVKAADGWTGDAWASELFPLPRDAAS
jgi:hypothetical protein